MEFSATVDFNQFLDLPPSTVDQASGQRPSPTSGRQIHTVQAEVLPPVVVLPLDGQPQSGVPVEGKEVPCVPSGTSGFGQNPARTVQAEHQPAVAGSPLDGHHLGVPGGEGGLSTIASPTCSSPMYSRSPEYSTGNSTLHGVPSIASYEEFEEYQAMMAEKTPEPVEEEKAKLKEKLAELIEENRQILRQADELRKSKEVTEALWLSEMERAQKAEADLEAAQRVINELKTKDYRAGRKLEETVKAKDDAMAELEKEKEEKYRLKRRLSEILRHAEADARPPRKDRSRSPLVRTSTSSLQRPDVQPTAEVTLLREEVVSPPVENQVSLEGPEVQAPQHEAPGPLRRMPKCRRRCCYQPPPPAPQVGPRPPRRSREVEQLGPIIEEVVFEERPRRRSRQPPARLVVDMVRRSYASVRNSLLPRRRTHVPPNDPAPWQLG
uniref:Coiled-coil domain-containing protein 6 n=1 Tax=Bursaphelenchus xylophilus TaxID=6326 RepID=A0A1I7S0P5_BURXY